MQDLGVGFFWSFEKERPLFKLENTLFMTEQIAEASLPLPLLGVIKKWKKKKTEKKIIKYDNPTLEVWNLGSPYFNICSKYKDLDLDLCERGNPGLSGDSETTIGSREDLGTNYQFIPVISHSLLLRLGAGRATAPHPSRPPPKGHEGPADTAKGRGRVWNSTSDMRPLATAWSSFCSWQHRENAETRRVDER